MQKVKDNWLLISTCVLYATLVLMTVIFFKERLSIDTSYYFFKSLNQTTFYQEHQRFVLFIAELPVVLGSQLHVSLKTILVSYSSWHTLFYLLMGVFFYWRYKKVHYLLLFLALQTIGIYFSFLNPIFELYYGMALLAVLAILLKENSTLNFRQYVLLVLLGFLIVTSHPYNVFLFLGVLLLDFIKRKNYYMFIGAVFGAICILFIKSQYVSEYEQGKISWILNFKENKAYLNLFNVAYLKSHLLYLLHYYADFLILLALFIALGFRRIARKKYALLLTGIVASFFLTHLSFNLDAPGGYAEQVFYILVAITLIGFFMELIPQLKNKNLRNGLLVLILMMITIRLYVQQNLAKDYGKRIDWITERTKTLRQENLCKGLFLLSDYGDVKSYLGWDIPYTSMIYSSLQGPNTISVVPMNAEDHNFFQEIHASLYYFRLNEIEPIKRLNRNYFNLCHQATYQLIRD